MNDAVSMAVEDATEGDDAGPMTRAEKREAQAARILEAAQKCFVRSGFQGASMHDICREAGMSPGALYRYFPSKESIIEAIAEADRRMDANRIAEAMDSRDIVEGLVAAMMTQIRHTHERGKAPLFTEIRAEAMRNEAIRQTCDCSMENVRGLIFERLKSAVERGEIRPKASIETLLMVMTAIGEGLILNDLPARGVDLDEVEAMVRSSVVANLCPVSTPVRCGGASQD